jgi:hypothetical protein
VGNAAGAISVKVAALTEGALKAMLLAKLKSVMAVLVGVALLGFGAVWIGYGTATGQQSKSKKSGAVVVNAKAALQKEAAKSNEALLGRKVQEASWQLTEVDAAKGTISVMSPPHGDSAFHLFQGKRIQPEAGVSLKGLSVDKKAVIQLDGKNVKLSELKDGMLLSLQMSKDSLTIIGIFAISADPHRYQYTVKAVDAVHNTIAVTIGKDGPTLEGVPVAKDAKIEALEMDVTNKTDVAQAMKLSDIKAGTPVRLEMALDSGKLLVKAIQVGGD